MLPEGVQLHGAQQYATSAEPFSDVHFAGTQPLNDQFGVPVSLPTGYLNDTMFTINSNEVNPLADDLLDWTHVDGSGLRNFDQTLLECMYGDLNSSGEIPDAFFGGF
jgi:hypothetical protein